jgi:hypothetical protein
VLLLLHVPPVTLLVNVMEDPTHVEDGPPIGGSVVLPVTTKVIVLKQPLANVYVIVHVPAATPVTTPVAGFTVAIEVLLLVHVPPAGVLDKVLMPPIVAVVVPEIVVGDAVTVTSLVAMHPPAV